MPRVWNKRDPNVPKDAVYVGRPSKWGNPYSHEPDRSKHKLIQVRTRELAVARYKNHLLEHQELFDDLWELRGKDLVCWCAPLPCHADVLLMLANSASL